MLMLRLPLSAGRFRQARHHVMALVALVLQVAVAGSAVWEPRAEVLLGVHIEGEGTLHAAQHNEATCGLCSARTQDSLPAPAVAALDVTRHAPGPTAQSQPEPAGARHSPTRPRAPPRLAF